MGMSMFERKWAAYDERWGTCSARENIEHAKLRPPVAPARKRKAPDSPRDDRAEAARAAAVDAPKTETRTMMGMSFEELRASRYEDRWGRSIRAERARAAEAELAQLAAEEALEPVAAVIADDDDDLMNAAIHRVRAALGRRAK
jgi:hypothetical protein